jgi:hypothetical protein
MFNKILFGLYGIKDAQELPSKLEEMTTRLSLYSTQPKAPLVFFKKNQQPNDVLNDENSIIETSSSSS